MGLLVPHVQHHKSGRKSFRRAYPPHLRPFLNGTQLRVSLGRPGEPGFHQRYDAALAEWVRNVDLAERKHASEFDTLNSPTIAYLAEAFRVEALEMDHEARWDPSERELHRSVAAQLQGAGVAYRSPWVDRGGQRWATKAKETLEASIGHYRAMRSNGDLEAIVGWWRDEALVLAEARGYALDPSDAVGMADLCRALNDTAISAAADRLLRLDGAEYPETPAEPARPSGASSPVSAATPLIATYDAYAEVQQIKASGRREGRNYLKNLIAFVGHDDAARITREDVVAWRDGLLREPNRLGKRRKPVSVRDKYLTVLRCTLGWAAEEKLIRDNVAFDVKVRVPAGVKVRDRDFTMPEARAILKASLKPPEGNLSDPSVRARRWIPWLCAYTGCRVNEMSQLRKEDVRQEDGFWIVNITPEAGDVKSGEFRPTPIHPHIIDQGFVAMVQALPAGPIFFDPSKRRSVDVEGNRHVKKVGERLARWVREGVGITDPNIQPNHAWRHLFKTLSAEAGIEERVADAIQGHAPQRTGRKYGKVNIRTKAEALAKFPRFSVDTADCL